jgi:antitoxin (DNA-binding transcriptional repressor) of toxin-antitoxin stability system
MAARKDRKKQEPEFISVSVAADRLGELVGRVAEGETVVLTRYNKPVAQLAPVGTAA